MALALGPTLAAGLYFGWIAADQYVSEARFVLAPNASRLAEGRIGGAPSLEVARDTQVVAQYLRSRALVEALEADAGLRARFEGPGFDPWRPLARTVPDWVAGLAPGAPVEDVVDYWDGMVSVRIAPSSGVVTFSLRAFSAEDARTLADRAVGRAEALINGMNARVWRDAVARAEELFAAAAARLAAAEGALAAARDAEGVLDAAAAAAAMTAVASQARSALLTLEQERSVKGGQLSRSSPLLRALDRRIQSLRQQIAAIEDTMAAPRPAGETQGGTLAGAIERFSEHEAEREVAQRQFLAASERLEAARIASEAQMLYLHVFVEPELAEEASRPRRALWIGGVAAVGLALWGVAVGGFSLVRNHIA